MKFVRHIYNQSPHLYLLDNGCIDVDNNDHFGTETNDLTLSMTSTQSSKPEPFHNPDYDFSGCTFPNIDSSPEFQLDEPAFLSITFMQNLYYDK